MAGVKWVGRFTGETLLGGVGYCIFTRKRREDRVKTTALLQCSRKKEQTQMGLMTHSYVR